MTLTGKGCATLLSALTVSTALAYDATIHVTLTEHAVDRSILASDPSLLADLGLPPYAAGAYLNAAGTGDVPLKSFFLIGTVNEDEYSFTGIKRPLEHFFDPQHNNFQGRGLVSSLTGRPSPNWALEDLGNVVQFPNHQQLFSYSHATTKILGAMTASSASARRQNAADAFQILGHVVHHLQDMAQPQHTRNEAHNEFFNPLRAYYEKYSELVLSPQLNTKLAQWPAYGIPSFPTSRHFWHTPGATSSTYVGMAEYTAQNFFTLDTGLLTVPTWPPTFINRSEFPKPNGSNTSVTSEFVQFTLPNGNNYSGTMDFVVGTVQDGLAGDTTGVKLATFSLLQRALNGVTPRGGVVTWAPPVFDANYPLLLPRSVAFSAGLINHFFRGRLAFTRNTSGPGWVVQNLSNQPMVGNFMVFSENSSGTRAAVPGALFYAELSAGQSTVLNVAEPPAGTQKLLVLFTGQLGQETRPGPNPEGWAAKLVPYTPTPVACGSSVHAQGANQDVTIPADLGTTAGPVQFEFEAYRIPDAYVLRAPNNQVLATSNGPTSGYHLHTFQYDPAAWGGAHVVTLAIDANVDPETRWTTTIGCPGQEIGNGDREQPMRTVHFVFGGGLPSAGDCSFNLYIDDQFRAFVSAGSGAFNIYMDMIKGLHRYEYRNKVCTDGIGSSFPAYYVDPAGSHQLLNPFFSGQSVGLMPVN
jgi:hypothetical protein